MQKTHFRQLIIALKPKKMRILLAMSRCGFNNRNFDHLIVERLMLLVQALLHIDLFLLSGTHLEAEDHRVSDSLQIQRHSDFGAECFLVLVLASRLLYETLKYAKKLRLVTEAGISPDK